jgi:hypothetical protein
VISPKDQLGAATKFFNFEFDGKTLVHHQGCWYHWSGRCYELVSDDDIKARLWKWLAKCRHWSKSSGNAKLQRYQPNRSAVNGILDALKAVANHPSAAEPPCWLEESGLPNPTNVIAFDNGLLEVESYLAGSVTLLDHTPNWFSTNCLPHKFDEKATDSIIPGLPDPIYLNGYPQLIYAIMQSPSRAKHQQRSAPIASTNHDAWIAA